jgi:hypothetical protein
MMVSSDCSNGSSEAVAINVFGQHASSRNLLMDAVKGVGVRIAGNEKDRCLAYAVKPPSGLDTLAASFEIDVH